MRSGSSGGCLTAFISAFSRIMLIMIWIARPVAWNAAFSTFILPCLGFLFLPFTTLMYLFLIQGVGSLQGLDWLWLFIAVLCDVANWGAAGYANKNYLPGGSSGSMQPAPAYVPPQPPAQTPPPAAPPSNPPDQGSGS